MATRIHCTDLVLLWHEHRPDPWATYIYTTLPLYIDPHTTSFVNHTQYLVPRWHVLWQYVVSSLTPLVGPRFQSYVPKLRSKATLPWVGFLPSFQVNANPVKSLLKPIPSSKPISQFPPSLYLAGCRETPCGLYSSILVSARVSKPAVGRYPAGYSSSS